VLAYTTILFKLKGAVLEEKILYTYLPLRVKEQLTTLIRCAHSIDKVVKLTNYSKTLEDKELLK
jgi:hypothetical protein